MNNVASIHNKLTSNEKNLDSKNLVLEFAKELGWSPSYFIEPSSGEKSNGYLVIEHGLQNSAIISFLKERNEDLTPFEEENLLALSYNNLVNWHITVDSRYINYYFILNREKRKVETKKIEKGNESEALSVLTFYEVINKKPNSNIKALDDVLIENLSTWKRILSAELNNNIDLVSLSHLFNATIFLRSIEDSKKRANELPNNSNIFSEIISESTTSINISQIINEVENRLSVFIPDYISNKQKITLFNPINILDLKRFFNSFYENEYNRFRYDFSIMTKQALSRIYQKYVSILSFSNSNYQSRNLFDYQPIPDETINKGYGAYYTPEYIARFFAKYVCKSYTEKEYDTLKILEPAVGSGIFLRTLLETQIEQRISKKINPNIDNLFKNIIGIDVDPNACLSTNLSLTLLHYIFNKQLSQPEIIEGDSIDIMLSRVQKGEKVDLVISNPPYINQNKKDLEITSKHKRILEGLNNGKIDIYQVFLKLSIDLLKPNGLGLFVLPHNFLIAESSKKLRAYVLENCNVELVVDLSAINVFENVSTYTILFILRKKIGSSNLLSTSLLMKCRSSVGDALTQLLNDNEIEEKQYQIYKAKNYFKPDTDWFILNKAEFDLLNKIKANKKIDTFLKVSQGVVTGKDDIFIRDFMDVKKEDMSIYKAFLPDKKIGQYTFDSKDIQLIFYPFIDNSLVDEKILSKKFKNTWKYLNEHFRVLNERSDVIKAKLAWWKLHSPSNPKFANSPKIVCPYMSITPKFSLDIRGSYITSRSPYFTLIDDNADTDLLYYFLGILNSVPCYWSLSLQSHKQSSGYNIFPLNILKKTPIPDPTLTQNSGLVSKIILLVKRILSEKNYEKRNLLETEVNKLSCELYKLTTEEITLLGLEL